MSFAHRQPDGFTRAIPLTNRPEFRQCRQLSLDEVPPLTVSAKIADATPYTIRYEDGLQAWSVDRFDKTVIRAYREYRNESDIDAGAFPIVAFYNDGKGQL